MLFYLWPNNIKHSFQLAMVVLGVFQFYFWGCKSELLINNELLGRCTSTHEKCLQKLNFGVESSANRGLV